MGTRQPALTIAGLSTISVANQLVAEILAFLRRLGITRSNVALDPFTDEKPKATNLPIAQVTCRHLEINDHLLEVIVGEPATWHCERVDITNDGWSLTLPSELRRFADVNSIDDYLARLAELPGMFPSLPDKSEYESPFTLPAALDYLDVVWKLKFGEYLVSHVGSERICRLSTAISTSDELDSCLSAFAEMAKGFRAPGFPGVGGHPLERLPVFLKSKLPQESHNMIDEAVELLDTVRKLRHGSQHFGHHNTAPSQWAKLKLGYPIIDYSTAWKKIQSTLAGALDTIRNEIQGNVEDLRVHDS